jgi:hypothetical protein
VRAQFQANRVYVVALTREKNTKKIVQKKFIDEESLSSGTYPDFHRLIRTNLATILNLRESLSQNGDEEVIPSPVHVEGGDKRKQRWAKSDIASPKENTNRYVLVDNAALSKSDDEFVTAADTITLWFKDTRFWPKTYLFITQFTAKAGNFVAHSCGILTTKLESGTLVTDPEVIVRQLQREQVGKIVKKGLVYPRIININGKMTTKPAFKIYEDTSRPAEYFYRFLRLRYPRTSEEIVGRAYSKLPPGKMSSLHDLERKLGEKAHLLDGVELTGNVDQIQFSASYKDLKGNFDFAEISPKKHLILIQGDRVEVRLGESDLVKDGVIRFLSLEELIQKLREIAGAD